VPSKPEKPGAAEKPAAAGKPSRTSENVTAERVNEHGEPLAPLAAPDVSLPARTESRAPAMISPDDARAAIAAKIAQSVRPKSGTAARPAASQAADSAPPPAVPTPAAAPAQPPPGAAPSLENSILAAIAEAVDVLVEDGETKPKKPAVNLPAKKRAPAPAIATSAAGAAGSRPQLPARTTPAERSAPAPAATTRPRTEPRQNQSEDIGDEIQRIIATYNRNRKDEPPA